MARTATTSIPQPRNVTVIDTAETSKPQSWNLRIETDHCTLLVSGFARTAFEATARAYRMARAVCPEYGQHNPYLHTVEQLADPYAATKVSEVDRVIYLIVNRRDVLPLAVQGCAR